MRITNCDIGQENILVALAIEANNLICADHDAPDSPIGSTWNLGHGRG